MDELFPIAAGLVLGVLFATGSRWLRPWWVRLALVVLAGLSATVLSGEYLANWAFAVVDISEAAPLAWIGFVAARALRRHFGTDALSRPVRPR